jgi:uncharacterized protein (DUF433 family)
MSTIEAMALDRITRNPAVMGGKPCVRGLRVTVGMIVGLVASSHSTTEILAAYPYLEEDDIRQALAYAAWRVRASRSPLPAVVGKGPSRIRHSKAFTGHT